MSFFDYKKAKEIYKDNDVMMEVIGVLEEFDTFHCLRDSNRDAVEVVKSLPCSSNVDYLKWMSLCDGGYLFDTLLLSTVSEDDVIDSDVEFSTLDELNNPDVYGDFTLPEGYYIIAMRSYGDPICLSDSDDSVYLYDTEAQEFTTVWDSFADFLADEINEALDLIENGDLMPFPLKEDEE